MFQTLDLEPLPINLKQGFLIHEHQQNTRERGIINWDNVDFTPLSSLIKPKDNSRLLCHAVNELVEQHRGNICSIQTALALEQAPAVMRDKGITGKAYLIFPHTMIRAGQKHYYFSLRFEKEMFEHWEMRDNTQYSLSPSDTARLGYTFIVHFK